MPIGGQGFVPKDVNANITGATSTKITNLSLATANTEYSHTLQSGLKGLIVKARGDAMVKISFTATESGTKYITIPKGAVLTLDGLTFGGITLYAQATKASEILEILELYS